MRLAPPPPDAMFMCPVLCCVLRARVCVARQVANDRGRRGDLSYRSSRRKRGLVGPFPACVTGQCATGAAIRFALGDAVAKQVLTGHRPPAAWAAWHAWVRARRDRESQRARGCLPG